ncbi:MAG: ECF-type sigma factor [Pseudomonadota bacterium]|nr:ECF-type sigma factor [Pseudomonadota bacterium]
MLEAAREGDRGAPDDVLATLYHELHTMARRQLAGQHGRTLDATALVHEAYLKLAGRREAKFDDRAHFFAYAGSAMRSVVIDYARQRLAQKRGGDLHRVTDLPQDLEGGTRLQQAQPEGGVVVREVLSIQEACEMPPSDTLAGSR